MYLPINYSFIRNFKSEVIVNARCSDKNLRALIYATKKALDFGNETTEEIIKKIEIGLIESFPNDRCLNFNEENAEKITERIKIELDTTHIYAKIFLVVFIGWLVSKSPAYFECCDGKSNILVAPMSRSVVVLHLCSKN